MKRYEINPKVDKFISKKEVKILVKGAPALSFKNNKMYNDSYLHYNAELYKTLEGYKYYLFKCFDDCTLYIMNCNKNIYEELEKIIELNDDIMIYESDDEDNCLIPPSYRKIDGVGGINTVMF